MTTVQRGAMATGIASVLVVALGLGAVALTGKEFTLAGVRSCFHSGGAFLTLGVFVFLAGLAVAFTVLRVRPTGQGRGHTYD